MKVLEEIKETVESLEYICKNIKSGVDNPTDMLLVSDEDMDEEFAISVLPLAEDLEGSLFIQFYYEYPFEININNKENLAFEILAVNRQLPLGHFNITISEKQIYYKYVLAFPETGKPSPTNFSDIIDMLIFSITHFKGGFKSFEKPESTD